MFVQSEKEPLWSTYRARKSKLLTVVDITDYSISNDEQLLFCVHSTLLSSLNCRNRCTYHCRGHNSGSLVSDNYQKFSWTTKNDDSSSQQIKNIFQMLYLSCYFGYIWAIS